MLFDNFVVDDVDLCNSIIRNISDVLDTYNHTNNNMLPFAFGVTDITNCDYSSISSFKNNIHCAINSFEHRLSNICVDVEKSSGNDQIIVSIFGTYKNEGKIMKLSFKKVMTAWIVSKNQYVCVIYPSIKESSWSVDTWKISDVQGLIKSELL